MKISAETVILVSFLAGGILVYILYYFTLKRLALKIQSGKQIKNTFNLWRKLTKVIYPSALQEIILKYSFLMKSYENDRKKLNELAVQLSQKNGEPVDDILSGKSSQKKKVFLKNTLLGAAGGGVAGILLDSVLLEEIMDVQIPGILPVILGTAVGTYAGSRMDFEKSLRTMENYFRKPVTQLTLDEFKEFQKKFPARAEYILRGLQITMND